MENINKVLLSEIIKKSDGEFMDVNNLFNPKFYDRDTIIGKSLFYHDMGILYSSGCIEYEDTYGFRLKVTELGKKVANC